MCWERGVLLSFCFLQFVFCASCTCLLILSDPLSLAAWWRTCKAFVVLTTRTVNRGFISRKQLTSSQDSNTCNSWCCPEINPSWWALCYPMNIILFRWPSHHPLQESSNPDTRHTHLHGGGVVSYRQGSAPDSLLVILASCDQPQRYSRASWKLNYKTAKALNLDKQAVSIQTPVSRLCIMGSQCSELLSYAQASCEERDRASV